MDATPTPTTARTKVLRVVGVTFAPGYPENLHRLHTLTQQTWQARESVAVVLRRNPANKHDTNAIEVHVPALGDMVGHVPADLAARLAPLLDDGVRFHVEIWSVAVDPANPDRPGVSIAIHEAQP